VAFEQLQLSPIMSLTTTGVTPVVPRNASPGGSWFIQTSPHPFPTISSIRDEQSGLELNLKATDRLVYRHNGNQCCDIFGNPVDAMGDLAPLREGLIPIVGSENDPDAKVDEAPHLLSDSPDCRPVGTLSGGTWYRLYNDDDTKTIEPVYCEQEGYYYTRQGVLLDSKRAATISEKWIGPAPSASAATTTTSPASNISQSPISSSSCPVPPGAKPGGIWLQQEYSGGKTSNAASLACCFAGAVPAAIVSQMKLDQRLVYKEPRGRIVDRHGRFVNPLQGTFTRIFYQPNPSYLKTGISSLPNNIGGSGSDNHDRDSVPPGCKSGGLWYKQRITNGKVRFLYREDPIGMSFFTREGVKVDHRQGIITPPL